MTSAKDLRDMNAHELREHVAERAATSSGCASSTPPASSRTPQGCARSKRELARALTIESERQRPSRQGVGAEG